MLWALINSLEKFRAMQPQSVATENADSEVTTLVKLFSNLNDLRKRLVIRYDSIQSTK